MPPSRYLSRVPEAWEFLRFWKSKKHQDLQDYLHIQGLQGKVILPHISLRFRALDETPPASIKVVILGQDPYHTPGMANGLAFSCQPGVPQLPASLLNIFKEYEDDLGFRTPRSGDLTSWSRNGILLLNTVLTCEARKPNSHKDKGWEALTYEIISYLALERKGICFLLWGEEAKSFRPAIPEDAHLVICSGHPSPLAYGAEVPFLGSKPFSRSLAYNNTIDWRLR